jgi:hypothetical protein
MHKKLSNATVSTANEMQNEIKLHPHYTTEKQRNATEYVETVPSSVAY